MHGLEALAGEPDAAAQSRILGVGIARAYAMRNRKEETGAPAQELARWREVGVAVDLAAHLP